MQDNETCSLPAKRNEMIKSIKQVIIPYLRSQGFKGTHPHFRRIGEDRLDFVSFQFSKYGGSFVIEIGTCGIEEANEVYDEFDIDSKKINCWYVSVSKRMRIGATPEKEDHWFSYDTKPSMDKSDYEAIAKQARDIFERQADSWYERLEVK